MQRPLRLAGFACVAAGGGLCLLAAALLARQTAWQAAHAGLFRVSPPAPAAARNRNGAGVRPAEPGVRAERGEPLARLRIPRVGVDIMAAEGSDPGTLLRSPGHMKGSALPGQPDNCIFAGHRDGPFGRLASVRKGDLVEVGDEAGTSLYRVESVTVVPKDDATLLRPTAGPVLTLVTCYPIHYVGRAPQRLVVRGALVKRAQASARPIGEGPEATS